MFLFYFIPLFCDMDLEEARKFFFEILKSRYRIYYQQSTMWILYLWNKCTHMEFTQTHTQKEIKKL